jgi:hypothetical protein
MRWTKSDRGRATAASPYRQITCAHNIYTGIRRGKGFYRAKQKQIAGKFNRVHVCGAYGSPRLCVFCYTVVCIWDIVVARTLRCTDTISLPDRRCALTTHNVGYLVRSTRSPARPRARACVCVYILKPPLLIYVRAHRYIHEKHVAVRPVPAAQYIHTSDLGRQPKINYTRCTSYDKNSPPTPERRDPLINYIYVV